MNISEDFYYALLTGWAVLFLFWIIIIIFIFLRKPPNSKLTLKIALRSIYVFMLLFFIIYFLPNIRFVFS